MIEENLDLFQDDPPADSFEQIIKPKSKLHKQIQKLLDADQLQRTRTWEYYENLRKNNATEYWKAATQVQLQKDAEALGPDFGGFEDE